MARRIFLHVGLPKTGTTFLQTMMWHNRDRLREQGFLYPGLRRMDHYRAWQEINDAPEESRNFRVGVWDALRQEIDEWPGDALISHEFFSLATRKQTRQVLADLAPTPVHVVVTARSYVLQFPAVWQEALKMGSDQSFDGFMNDVLSEDPDVVPRRGAWSWKSQDIPIVLRNWSRSVPNDQVTVVTVPPPGAPRHLLWDRWCAALGIDGSDFDGNLPFANESIGATQAALLRRLLPHLKPPLTEGNVRHKWVRGYLAHQVLVPQRGERFGPRPEQVDGLLKPSRKAVRNIARRGYRVVGDLDDLVLRESPGTANPDDVSESAITAAAVAALEQLLRDHREAVNERDAWQREARRLQRELRRRGPIGRARTVARRLLRRGDQPQPEDSTDPNIDEESETS